MMRTEMMKLFISLLLTSLGVWCKEDIIGVGKWTVLNIVQCPEHGDYPMDIEVSRKKVNRSHDGFTGCLKLEDKIDNEYGITIDICKYVDGGCKPFQVIKDDSLCSFMKKYAQTNVENVLRMAELDPPDCPIPKGEYSIKNYVFDYYELPEKGMYGKYDAKTMIMLKDATFQEKIMACLIVTLIFEKDDRNGD